MQITLDGHHVEITDAIKEHVNTKFTKLERFFDRINNAHVILNVEKFEHIAEATLHINHGEIYAKAHSENMYTAIDLLSDKLVKQLNKHKNKMNNH